MSGGNGSNTGNGGGGGGGWYGGGSGQGSGTDSAGGGGSGYSNSNSVYNVSYTTGSGNSPSGDSGHVRITEVDPTPIVLGTTGVLKCRRILYKYRQARNMVADGDFELAPSRNLWSLTGFSVTTSTDAYKSNTYLRSNTTAVVSINQVAPAGVVGHKYYLGVRVRNFSANRYLNGELTYWASSSTNYYYRADFNGEYLSSNGWLVRSGIVAVTTAPSGATWRLQVTVDKTGYPSDIIGLDRVIMVDLTETFGAGNEPTKAWCDEHITNWTQYYGIGRVSPLVTSSSVGWTGTNLGFYDYQSLDSGWEPRDYMYAAWQAGVNQIVSTTSWTTSSNTAYFASYEALIGAGSHVRSIWTIPTNWSSIDSIDGNGIPIVSSNELSGGGGMGGWTKICYHSSSLSSQNVNGNSTLKWFKNIDLRICNLSIVHIPTFLNAIANDPTRPTIDIPSVSQMDKAFMARWHGGVSPTIIRIRDPNYSNVSFNSKYDVTCNDLIIDPSETNVRFLSWGAIRCRGVEQILV